MFHFSDIMENAMQDEEYMSIVSDIIKHPKVLQLREYNHHGIITRYDHCLNVSYIGYKIADKFNWDKKSIARAGLLHDFFLYDWRTYKPSSNSFRNCHAVIHGKIALKTAENFFELNKKEKEMIKKHMWPVTLVPPRYMMTYLIGIVDKYCAIKEVIEVRFNVKSDDICTDP